MPAPVDTPYPGTIIISVDATDLAQRIFRVKQVVPVQAGPLILLLPQWLPGHHSPGGPIDKIAGLLITANGHRLEWKRDPLNVFAFNLEIPQGVTSVTTEFEFITPTDQDQGRVVMTPSMLDLQWNALVLYPAGHYASRIDYDASVTYPAGWQAFTALDVAGRNGDTVHYKPVPLDILVDSPVYAGRYTRQVDLAPGAKVPVHLDVVADTAKELEAKPAHLAEHVELVKQATILFGAQHFDHYDFLFSISDQMSGNGLEHQRSSEDGASADYFSEWDSKTGSSDLLGHEYTHSWNGKFRRPADLWTPNYNVPMQDSLLWVYEGQTQYWGNVLTGRSGLRPLEASRDAFAVGRRALPGRTRRPGLAQHPGHHQRPDRGPAPAEGLHQLPAFGGLLQRRPADLAGSRRAHPHAEWRQEVARRFRARLFRRPRWRVAEAGHLHLRRCGRSPSTPCSTTTGQHSCVRASTARCQSLQDSKPAAGA